MHYHTEKTIKPIAPRILKWFKHYGRKDLPWQNPATPYTVWVSEIMLQQTQVATVIPYFNKFIKRFPTILDLAKAEQDEVLHYWSGLGYYARARNLHQCAKQIIEQHQGQIPNTLNELESLSGIGKSTAGAILSLGHKKFGVILDGNVRRVLARHYGIEGWYGKSVVAKTFWYYAEQVTPVDNINSYNQAMMDIGATLCTKTKPLCSECPLRETCVALKQNRVTQLPFKKPKKENPIRTIYMLVLRSNSGAILLQKRPAVGIWGGLWSFPEFATKDAVKLWLHQYCVTEKIWEELTPFVHVFSHFSLVIHPIIIECSTLNNVFDSMYLWYKDEAIGLPAPVEKIVKSLPQLK